MFETWRRAWREAAENFRRELYADDTAAGGVAGMRRELENGERQLAETRREAARIRDRATAERYELDACRRRERLARKIGDDETADLAARFARRHEERAALLDRKAKVLEAEAELQARELAEMRAMIREAAARIRDGESRDEKGGGRSRIEDPLDPRLDPTEQAFRDLEARARRRAAAQRLDDLKRSR